MCSGVKIRHNHYYICRNWSYNNSAITVEVTRAPICCCHAYAHINPISYMLAAITKLHSLPLCPRPDRVLGELLVGCLTSKELSQICIPGHLKSCFTDPVLDMNVSTPLQ